MKEHMDDKEGFSYTPPPEETGLNVGPPHHSPTEHRRQVLTAPQEATPPGGGDEETPQQPLEQSGTPAQETEGGPRSPKEEFLDRNNALTQEELVRIFRESLTEGQREIDYSGGDPNPDRITIASPMGTDLIVKLPSSAEGKERLIGGLLDQ